MNKLKLFIRKHKIRQVEMADKIGCSPTHLSRVLNGKLPLTQDMIDRLKLSGKLGDLDNFNEELFEEFKRQTK